MCAERVTDLRHRKPSGGNFELGSMKRKYFALDHFQNAFEISGLSHLENWSTVSRSGVAGSNRKGRVVLKFEAKSVAARPQIPLVWEEEFQSGSRTAVPVYLAAAL